MPFIQQGTNELVDLDDGAGSNWKWNWLEKSVLVDPVNKFSKAKLNLVTCLTDNYIS